MNVKDKLSYQGLKDVDTKIASKLKENFKKEVIEKNDDMVTHGYFIGKTLLGKLLRENPESAGILVSFGMDNTIAKGGQLHLVIEHASGKSKDDEAIVLENLNKYATTKFVDGTKGPDNVIPLIKPTPPHS